MNKLHRCLLVSLVFFAIACNDDNPLYTGNDTGTSPDARDAASDAHQSGDTRTPDTDDAVCELSCDTPPVATCVDANTLRGFASTGRCENDECTYDSVDTPCAQGCEDGACKGDPCAGVVCDQPPTSCHESSGTCHNGQCDYDYANGKSCDDANSCTADDVCQAGQCAGEAVACNTPPAPTCVDADHLKVFGANGICQADGCSYQEELVTCSGGCADDQCVDDPCEGVTCDTPPNGCYQTQGTCDNGVCAYAFDNGASCDDSDSCTVDDQCHNGTCSGPAKSCDEPPATTCKDANTLWVPVSVGVCGADGDCAYDTNEQACAYGCDNGACMGDPCAGVTCDAPPSDSCQGNTLRTYDSDGTCSAGACNYAESQTECGFGCESGACSAPDNFLISEVYYDGPGSDTDSFIEIHGPANTAVNGLSLVAVNGNGGADYATIELDGQTGDEGFFVVMQPTAPTAWLAVADQLDDDADLQNGPDSLQLRFDSDVVDALAYDEFGGGEVAAGLGEPAADAPSGKSLSRDENLSDTRDNFSDFQIVDPTPGSGVSGPCQTGQCEVFDMIDTGLTHNCATRSDGTVVCWGSDDDGQATPPSGTFSQVSAGFSHTCGVRADATVECWGYNGNGRATPPSGTFSQVSSGDKHTCGVKTDGSVACWGHNAQGAATPPSGTFSQISAGTVHVCGVQTNGTVSCWGDDYNGQSSPPSGTFLQVSAGGGHTCGVKADGTVECWGSDFNAQSSPPSGTFSQVSAGTYHNCGVKTDGTLACWGAPNFTGRTFPPSGTFSQVSAGSEHNCGIKTDGTVECWGSDYDGQATPPTP